ncbi:hypothetical protein YPPY72_0471, partial [Yersinia pestis PY-72]
MPNKPGSASGLRNN